MTVLVLGSGLYRFPQIDGVKFVYNDIQYPVDYQCDMRELEPLLDTFDCILASPPCNYYSRANYRRETSKYAQATKDLLPWCQRMASDLIGRVPMIIENVRNRHLIPLPADLNILYSRRHTFFANHPFSVYGASKSGLSHVCSVNRQGDEEVHETFFEFVKLIKHEMEVYE